ncbi:MAG: acyl-[Spirochaetaceae bacterium]|nr:acyl-[acyl-carrier-protein] thioesterase [Spirochaetaceae bacterium]
MMEQTFRHYFDENGFFCSEGLLSFCQCNTHHQMSIYELFRLTSDAATEDFCRRGFSWHVLKSHDIAILLSRQSFRIHKWPKANGSMKICTREEAPMPLQTTRYCVIYDSETGEKLVSGYSLWIVVDLKTRKILRTSAFTLRPDPTFATEVDWIPPGKIHIDSVDFQDENNCTLRKIFYSDMDANGHLNNARYGDFITDAIPDDLQDKITDIRINFAKEAAAGDSLTVCKNYNRDEGKIVVVGKNGDEICFESEVFF